MIALIEAQKSALFIITNVLFQFAKVRLFFETAKRNNKTSQIYALHRSLYLIRFRQALSLPDSQSSLDFGSPREFLLQELVPMQDTLSILSFLFGVFRFLCPVFHLNVWNMGEVFQIGGDHHKVVINGTGTYEQVKLPHGHPLRLKGCFVDSVKTH